MARIFISTSSFNTETPEINEIRALGYEVVINPHKRRLTADEIAGFLAEGEVVGLLAGVEPLSADVLTQASALRTIARCGVGMESVDLDKAKELGISVTNTPDAPTMAVAELALGLTLALLRKIPQQDSAIRSGEWARPMGNLLGKQTLGIIGFGRIGKAFARLAKPFGCEIITYDPFVTKGEEGVEIVSLNELLNKADVISLHMPATPESTNIINAENISKMKQGAHIINTARGQLVDENALLEALKNGKLGGAALDVFIEEPYKGPLSELNNVVLSAHTGSYAAEARQIQETLAAQNLLAELKKLPAQKQEKRA